MPHRIQSASCGAALVLAIACALLNSISADAAGPNDKPSIIFLLTDDQDVNMGVFSQPKLQKLWMSQGAVFSNSFASTPVCCPSRGGIQTGRYIHNVPMKNNSVAGNCSSPEWQAGAEQLNVATYMKSAGYRTFYTGKYLNAYGLQPAGGPSHIPPGWDDWQGLVGNSIYYNYAMSNNGVREHYGLNRSDYLPTVILNKSMAFLKNATSNNSSEPFFMMIGTPSCHDPTEPAPEYADQLAGVSAPHLPNYGTAFADKHWFVAKQPDLAYTNPYTSLAMAYNDLQFRRRALTLKTVDDIVGNLTEFLESTGRLDNTYLFYASDHGYHLGNFGVLKDKRLPYETDIRIPTIVRGPGVKPGSVITSPIQLPDFTPTFLDIAGLKIPDTMDGISMLPALNGQTAPLRTDILLEYHGEGQEGAPVIGNCSYQDMNCAYVGQEMRRFPPYWNNSELVCSCQDAKNNTYECVRTVDEAAGNNYLYCEFSTGFKEFYDLTQDPYQLTNAINTAPADLIEHQAARLEFLRTCSGPTCKTPASPIPSWNRQQEEGDDTIGD
eukprot:m.357882 g.357882  ORF g.357882 m.357882 type:complete len:551 (+) comp17968_c0_seq1:79-1731(+)